MLLSNQLKRNIKKSDIISFDIFDTLLLRSYLSPNDVFAAISEEYKAPDFYKIRINAEPAAMQELISENKDDVTFDEIYDYIPSEYKHFKEIEAEFESKHLFSNTEMLDVLKYALSLNKRIIIASDMYLPYETLHKTLVRELGTDKFKLYVSCEFGKRKHTGNLFKKILDDTQVKPSKILHIGDNYESDYKIPRKLGLRSYHYKKLIDKFIKNDRIKEFLKNHNDLQGRTFIATLFVMLQKYNKTDYWQNLAFMYGGPLAYNYTNLIIDSATEQHLSDIAFVARDGYTLQKTFDILNKNNKIKSHYVYAPRFTNTLAYLDFGVPEVIEERKSVLLKFLVNNGFAKTTDDIKQHTETLKSLYVTELTEYKKYLEQKNFGKTIGIVDSISMSFSAQKLISKTLSDTDCHGFYWWIVDPDKNKNPSATMFYTGQRSPCFCHLIVFFLAAPTKPIHRVLNNQAVYKENIDKYEQIKIDLYPTISKSIVDFTQIAQDMGLSPVLDAELMFDWINYFVIYATKQDFKKFKNIKNGVDQSHTKYDTVLKKLYTEKNFLCFNKKTFVSGLRKIYFLGICVYKYKKD